MGTVFVECRSCEGGASRVGGDGGAFLTRSFKTRSCCWDVWLVALMARNLSWSPSVLGALTRKITLEKLSNALWNSEIVWKGLEIDEENENCKIGKEHFDRYVTTRSSVGSMRGYFRQFSLCKTECTILVTFANLLPFHQAATRRDSMFEWLSEGSVFTLRIQLSSADFSIISKDDITLECPQSTRKNFPKLWQQNTDQNALRASFVKNKSIVVSESTSIKTPNSTHE